MVAMPISPTRSRSTRSAALEAALHGLDEPAEHALGLRLARNRASDVADVAAARGGEQGEADQCGESWSAVRIGQAGDLLRAPNAHCTAQHTLHIVGDVLQFRAAAGE